MTLEIHIPTLETVLCILGAWSIAGPFSVVLFTDPHKTVKEHGLSVALTGVIVCGPALWFALAAYFLRAWWVKRP
ncbi:MAG: hypothetical protein M0R80_26115 [Proteobacteria bacterium]|jgi:hypothetical protein|nr:hypothetical protein [Pseudomonadota bacterium]